ncbi:helix-turn-helix domain-containing protein [Seohaeicola sp. SP36]|uniref:helix-turn-helix domain-containing protein n=1 Tax=unclassified Seohaeicola TaxID=2641111 RepID=UPI00237BE798|nr:MULTISPECIES: helix-turn-helix domain-containing protein [unclassified Seohaeicola]MDD9707770.1 helix-turn-helix domain-containing protein [Seohaeicola sp. 4SK31]MDD9734766.1 helix-turn-helix domain-containing protein [Seohaeicola sp. SP36]
MANSLKQNTPMESMIGKDDRQLLTVRQIAALDSCSEKTVYRAIKAGLLPVVRVGPGGKLIRITKAAHMAYRQMGGL